MQANRYWQGIGAVLVILATSFAFAQDRVRLLVWDQHGEAGGQASAIERIHASFMAEHPHIEIVRELTPFEQLRATARTALASGTGPDVIYHDVTPSRDLFQAGLILSLEDYAERFGWRDRFFEAGLDFTEVDGELMGLGLEYEFVGVFVNKTLFEQNGWDVPQTHEESLEFCRMASAEGYVPYAHSQNPGWQNFFSFTMPVHNYVGADYMEGLLFRDEGRWDTPEMVYAVNTVYEEMKEANCFVPDLNGLDYNGAQELFYTGESPLFPTGTWIIGRLLEATADTFETEMMPWPSIDGRERVYTAGMGSAYFISASTEHPEEAALYLDYLFSDEAVAIWVEEANFIPPIPVDTTEMDLDPLFRFALDTLTVAGSGEGDLSLGYNVDLLVPVEFNTMMMEGFQAVWDGRKTVEDQLADLQRIWEARGQ
jgi:raffinose/stachyose/melibiose transport system substrate-binding protein